MFRRQVATTSSPRYGSGRDLLSPAVAAAATACEGVGGKERGEGGADAPATAAATAAWSPSSWPREERLAWLKKWRDKAARRGVPSPLSLAASKLPAACPERHSQPQFYRRLPGLHAGRSPGRRGPHGELPGWAAPRAGGLLPLPTPSPPKPLRAANSNKIESQGRFKKIKTKTKIFI